MTEEQAEQLNQLSVNEDDDFVDPWTVSGKSETGIDYDKLISKYSLKAFRQKQSLVVSVTKIT